MLNGGPDISLMEIEAYAMSSTYIFDNSDHVFVIDKSRTIEWKNAGGGWDDSRPKRKVASTRAYKEWVLDFIPPNNLAKSGIRFGFNGVCQTYANLELLIAETDASVKAAERNYLCLWYYGKYGMGVDNLKDLLKKSYNEVSKKYNDPYNALPKVLTRIDNSTNDELEAWRKVSIEHCGIDVDAILRKIPMSDVNFRYNEFVKERERLYQKHKSDGNSSVLRAEMKKAIYTHSEVIMNYLTTNGIITEKQKNNYLNNINNFLSQFTDSLEAYVNSVIESGFIQ